MNEDLPAPKGKTCTILIHAILTDGFRECGEDAVANMPIVVFENTPDPKKMGPRMGFVQTDVCERHLEGLRINKEET